MNSIQKTNIRIKIIERFQETKEEIEDLKLLTKPISPENAIGRVSRMDAINNKTINDRALRKAKEKLRKLDLALSRVEEDDFGNCRSCNGEIQVGRLLLMPESNTCVKCASKK
tara:strand:+ start:50 stop:388 length:339 start_codon:yes stop_codon:yes gene_type:complete